MACMHRSTRHTFQFINILVCFIVLYCWNHILDIWTDLQTWKDVFLNYCYIFGNEIIFNDFENEGLLQPIHVNTWYCRVDNLGNFDTLLHRPQI
jgi:hypothetical protein